MERNKFIFYKDWWEALQQMPTEMSRSIIEAIMDYALYGIDTENPQIKYSIYSLVKSQIDRDSAKYEAIINRNRENGKKGGRPKKSQSEINNPNNPMGCLETQITQPNPNNPTKPKKANNNDNNIDNDIDNDTFKFPKGNLKIDVDDKSARVKKTDKSKDEQEDELTQMLLSDGEAAYWEQAAMGLRISAMGWDIPGIRRMLPPFQEGNKAKMNYHRDLGQLKQHFYDWLKIQADYQRKNRKQQTETPKSPLDEFIRERLGYNPADLPPR